MNHLGIVCAAVALSMFATSVGAQQTTPAEPVPSTQPAPQNQTAVPPPPSTGGQASPEMPPPFPPMPKRAPQHRFVDMGEHHATGHRTTHAHAAATHVHRKAARARRAALPTQRTQRRCLGLSVSQAMRRSNCKAFIRQQLESEHVTAKHQHRKAHGKTTTHRSHVSHMRRHHHSS